MRISSGPWLHVGMHVVKRRGFDTPIHKITSQIDINEVRSLFFLRYSPDALKFTCTQLARYAVGHLVTLVRTSAVQAAILIRTQMELHLDHLHSAVCTASHSMPLALFSSFYKTYSLFSFKEIPAPPVSIFTYVSVDFLPVNHHQRDGQITRAGSW